jgi:hypothetical protein
VPEPLPSHQGISSQDTVDHAKEIDLDHRSPVVDRTVEDLAPAGDASVVEEKVEAPVRLDGFEDSFLEARKVSNVKKGGSRYATLALQSP